jgi:hypothetical protein
MTEQGQGVAQPPSPRWGVAVSRAPGLPIANLQPICMSGPTHLG